MTTRELWREIMNYGSFDRMPVFHWGGWKETRRRWIAEGMNEQKPEHEYFGVDPLPLCAGPNLGLLPTFDEVELERTSDYVVMRQADGTTTKSWLEQSSIPQPLGFLLQPDGTGWPEYKKRLQPDPRRIGPDKFSQPGGVRTVSVRPEPFPIPATLEEFARLTHEVHVPVCVGTASIFGWIRNWLGVENLAYVAYDNPALLGEMIETITDLAVWCLEQVLPHYRVDMGWGWEDICYRSGPLVSPTVFRQFGVPAYRRIADTLHRFGISQYVVDCDGLIDALVPGWLEAGVNVMFPVEIGAWHADPAAMRRKWGKDLLIFGGIDKLVLARGRDAIDAEIERRRPLMAQGGFVPLPDHLITPDVPLRDYEYYLATMRELRI